jgi:hypothetical protein
MTYKSVWQLPHQSESFWQLHRWSPPCLVQLRITPYGWDDAAYFHIGTYTQKKKSSKMKAVFENGENHRLMQPGSDRAAIQRYLDWVAANPDAIALCTNTDSLGLFPEEFLPPQGRRKTATELKLDEAMLWVEVGDHEAARPCSTAWHFRPTA